MVRTEPPWTFDLTGTTKVVNAMGDCFATHHIMSVGAPFSGTASPSGVSVTQPYGGSLDGVSNPYSGSSTSPTATETPPGKANPDTGKQPLQPAVQIPAPLEKPEAAKAGGQSCKESWKLCNDNADLVPRVIHNVG